MRVILSSVRIVSVRECRKMINPILLEKARAKGTDAEFQAWTRLWPSVLTNDFKEWLNGEGRSVFAHVERVSRGSGKAIKSPYSGLPLTQEQHSNTHQHGESYYEHPEWWERKSIEMLTKWVNGVSHPVLPEKRTKETYIIESEDHIRAFQEMLTPYFLNPKAKPVEITIQTGKKRSNKQNRGMWKAVYGGLVDFYSENPLALAKDVVEYVLMHKPSCDFVHEIMKGLCNENQSTATLKVQQHCNYFDRIAVRFMDKHKHEVKMPVNEGGYYDFNYQPTKKD